MADIALVGNIPAINVPEGAAEATIQVQIVSGAGPSGGGGNGEGDGFITVTAPAASFATWTPGACTVTLSQP